MLTYSHQLDEHISNTTPQLYNRLYSTGTVKWYSLRSEIFDRNFLHRFVSRKQLSLSVDGYIMDDIKSHLGRVYRLYGRVSSSKVVVDCPVHV